MTSSKHIVPTLETQKYSSTQMLHRRRGRNLSRPEKSTGFS
ncbi:hypothetical protein CVT25_000678 [Psilocybe cyanescens]|uniref:Uncharacterized protein n=1 Tax=Psilocybe cyanescens TaxID=93625 RepID=A0A409WZH7_PSICY|nr:hypothetical protein CVT25_000678 [Psilocybe cyanescens]